MANELLFDEAGKSRPKPSQETAAPQKDNQPLTAAQIQSKPDAATLTKMQRTMGNAAVQRFLAQRSGVAQRSGAGPSELDDETASAINSRRGGGHALDAGIATKAGAVMGQDFSGVNIHTDSHADNLSRQLGAKAFTTGNDVFFQSGTYNPSSSEGQRLISHELTHVVQQGASAPAVQGKMTVNDPNDQYETEADAVAEQVMSKADDSTAVQLEETLEEEEVMTKRDEGVQREEMPEEELMAKRDEGLQRQESPEDELL